ncbi:hypothetical protein SmJEL517_g00660 [Synchytrium microbalum]|uniref:Cytochrome P450 n=1 Tax=Synchytrium microbalum TaxID=1806994 RepID=A0A507C9K2_9FUNG|nr:uncharacterized protein SmJEL517_g00660 [Synchytrium microbalum]TPX37757.1 hypothetical protein SmJEL517_g00660 [Synchytrium microbalum]
MNKATATVTVIAVVGTALAALYFSRRRKNQIPSDIIYPFVGNLPQLSKYTEKNSFHEYMLSLAKYGKIARFVVGSSERILLNDAAESARILLSPEWDKIDQGLATDGIFNNSLIGLHGDVHKRHRKALQPAFGPAHLRNAFLQSSKSTTQLIEQWKSHKGDFVVELLASMNAITMDVIGRVALGQDLGMVASLSQPSENGLVIKAEMENLKIMQMKRRTAPHFLWPFLHLTGADARHETQGVRNFLASIIQKKRAALDLSGKIDLSVLSNSEKFETTTNWDVIDRLIAGNAGAKGVDVVFTPEQISDEVFVFFLAGSDTTAMTLTTLFALLASHPHVLKKLQHDIDSVLGRDGVLTQEILQQLTYLDCTMKEVMRFFPVAIQTQFRTPLVPTTVCGYTINPGQPIAVNTSAIQRNPEYWQDPDKFWPERWENGFTPVSGSYVPFGNGIANCIGQRMANIESRTVAALLLQSFDVELVEGQEVFRTTHLLTGYNDGLLFRFKSRIEN